MNKYKKMVVVIFFIVLALRLWVAFALPHFTYDSYFHLRQAEAIQETGIPLYEDPLSYGGRSTVFLPLYDYVLAVAGSLILLELAAKLVANILMALLVPLSYVFAKEITTSKRAPLFAAFIAGFIPIAFEPNNIGPHSLILPLTLLALYSIIRIRNETYHYVYLISFTVLSLTSPITALFLWGLLVYLIISKLEDKKIQQEEIEITLFSVFLFTWIQFLFYKNVFLDKGIAFIWQNIPSSIVSSYFSRLSIGESIIFLGVIPLVAGLYVIYKNLFSQKNHYTNLLISFAIGIVLLLALQLIPIKMSLLYLGIIFAILFAPFYEYVENYIKKTKADKHVSWLAGITVAVLLVTSVSPSLAFAWQQGTPHNSDIEALQWIKEHTPTDSTVAVAVNEGHLLNYVAERKNIIDSQFVGVSEIDKRFKDLERIYVTQYQTEAVDLLDKYSADYVMISSKPKDDYDIEKLRYIKGKCFRNVFKGETKVYETQCNIEITS